MLAWKLTYSSTRDSTNISIKGLLLIEINRGGGGGGAGWGGRKKKKTEIVQVFPVKGLLINQGGEGQLAQLKQNKTQYSK